MNNEINYVSPFKRFCVTIGNLPTAYIESMSYYEGLTFLVNYLSNNVIPALNNNGEVVEELQKQFVILKNYVDNYFENLDVQDEINNKLDEMAANGELTDIIAQYLGLAGMLVYNTVADMKAAENISNGSTCQTLGYHSANDGGMSIYKVREVINTDVIDEQYLIALHDNTLVAELLYFDKINIKQLGAEENSTDIGAMINTITNTKNKIAYVPEGEWIVDTPINPSGRKTIIIDGNLTYNGADECIKINSEYNIIKTKKITSSGVAVLFENNSNPYATCLYNVIDLRDIVESSGDHAIYFHSINQGICYNKLSFKGLLAKSDKYGIYLKTESTGDVSRYIAENTIRGGVIARGTYGIYFDTSNSGANGECTGNHFEEISFEGVTNAICMKGGTYNTFNNIRIAEVSGKVIKLITGPKNNVFNIASNIIPSKIDLTEKTTSTYHINVINTIYCNSNVDPLANKVIIQGNKIKLQDLIKANGYKNITGSDADITFTDNDAATFIEVNNTGSPTITLNQYYGSAGISDIIVKSSKAFTMVDSFGTSVCSNSDTLNMHKIYCHCYNKNDTDKWEIQDFTV